MGLEKVTLVKQTSQLILHPKFIFTYRQVIVRVQKLLEQCIITLMRKQIVFPTANKTYLFDNGFKMLPVEVNRGLDCTTSLHYILFFIPISYNQQILLLIESRYKSQRWQYCLWLGTICVSLYLFLTKHYVNNPQQRQNIY